MYKKNSALSILGEIFVYILVGLVVYLVTSAVGCWLWGIIAVGIFNFPALTFWQFYGLQVLISILAPIHISSGGRK